MAQKRIADAEFEEWSQLYVRAQKTLKDRDEQVAKTARPIPELCPCVWIHEVLPSISTSWVYRGSDHRAQKSAHQLVL